MAESRRPPNQGCGNENDGSCGGARCGAAAGTKSCSSPNRVQRHTDRQQATERKDVFKEDEHGLLFFSLVYSFLFMGLYLPHGDGSSMFAGWVCKHVGVHV